MDGILLHAMSSAERSRAYECTSFVETQATALLKEFPVEFVKYPLLHTSVTNILLL